MTESFDDNIKSVTDYISIVNDYKPTTKVLFGNYVKLFRGMASSSYNYIPALGRGVDPMNERIPVEHEQKMIHQAKIKMPELFKDDKLPIQTLTKLQHYELPTRLLDFTSNSLVALFFACQNKTIDKKEQDGKVMVCLATDKNIYDCFSPFVNAVADMQNLLINNESCTRMGFLKALENKDYWSLFKAETKKYINTNIVNVNENKKKQIFQDVYNTIYGYDFLSPIFFEPEQNSERIRRQQGLFLLFPNAVNEKENFVKDQLCKWKPQHSMEIIIPYRYKRTIRKELKNLGITKSYLFPEPEKICADIFEEIKSLMGEE